MRRLLIIVSLLAWSPCLQASEPGSAYVCRPLGDALEDLRAQGLKIIYSSDLVRPGLQVKSEPPPDSPRRVLDELLAPHGLRALESSGILLVVRAEGAGSPDLGKTAVAASASGLLPAWVDLLSLDGDLVEASFPGTGGPGPDLSECLDARVPETARYLIIRLDGERPGSWDQAAFDLKECIVAARSRAPGLRVALEGSRQTVEALVSRGLAPYVDAYTYRDDRFVPSADPTGRLWWRTAAAGPQVLDKLVTAGERGDELVVVEGHAIDPVHQAFLQRIQASAGGNLSAQPRVQGIAAERVRFFVDPDTGDYYLAVYAEPGQTRHIFFDVDQELDGRSLFPTEAAFDLRNFARGSELTLEGAYPYYLFELVPRHPDVLASGVMVRSTRIVDPYEEVVKNQIFQQREQEKFRSLDVMEYITVTPQRANASQYTWEHRILRRTGRLADYHHLGLLQNGTRVPDDKLLKGRIYRSEALLQLEPLEIELDETYRYKYLGEDAVDGFPTWKIRFEPIKKGTVADGTFISGIVWLDQETNAHRRMKTFQVGLDSSLISQERTIHYQWVASGGECFWDWRRRDGVRVSSFLGDQYSTQTETSRAEFHYNRPDIEEVAQAAYDSDILIHVETPPEGHRWLVKNNGERELGDFQYPPPRGPANQVADDLAATSAAQDRSQLSDTENPGSPYGDRHLAGIHAFSTRTFFSLGGFGDDDNFDLYPGFVVTDSDLFNKGYQAYLGLFLEEAIVSLGKPNLFGGEKRQTGLFLTAQLLLPYSGYENYQTLANPGEEPRNLNVETHGRTLSLSLGIPIHKGFTINTSYLLRDLSFAATADTDVGFVLPSDTLEHVLDVSFDFHWRKLSTSVGFELGQRDDWQPWGLGGDEPLEDAFQVFRWQGGYFQRIGKHRSLAATLTYWKGNDLDRFSRLRNGRTRDRLAGFRSGLVFDQAIHTSLAYNFSLFRRWPIHLRLDGGRQWLDAAGDDPRDFVGGTFRFLIHGPLRLDIWPSVSYGIYSSVPGEAGHTTFGLTLARRQ